MDIRLLLPLLGRLLVPLLQLTLTSLPLGDFISYLTGVLLCFWRGIFLSVS